MSFPAAGRVTLGFIYSNGGNSDRFFNAYLDHDYYVSAPPTADFDTWDTAYVVLDVPGGEADLRLVSLTADGGPNIDAFGFSLDGVCRVSEGCPEIKNTAENESVEKKPDSLKTDTPAKDLSNKTDALQVTVHGDVLHFVSAGQFHVNVYDMTGRLVADKMVANVSQMTLSSMVRHAGIYRVVVKQGNAKYGITWARVK